MTSPVRLAGLVAAIAVVAAGASLSQATGHADASTVSTTAEPYLVTDWETPEQQNVPGAPPPGWEAQWTETENPSGEPTIRVTKGAEPVRDGAVAARFELDRDNEDNTSGPRTEIAGANHYGERWYGFSIFLPKTYVVDRAPEILTQWHHDSLVGSPPLAVGTIGDQWFVEQCWEDDYCDLREVGAFRTGRWTDWVVHVKWSDGDDGVLEVWKDGERVPHFGNQPGKNDWAGNDQVYMKQGIYKWPWDDEDTDTSNRVVFQDETRIADENGSYETVAPGGLSPNPGHR